MLKNSIKILRFIIAQCVYLNEAKRTTLIGFKSNKFMRLLQQQSTLRKTNVKLFQNKDD